MLRYFYFTATLFFYFTTFQKEIFFSTSLLLALLYIILFNCSSSTLLILAASEFSLLLLLLLLSETVVVLPFGCKDELARDSRESLALSTVCARQTPAAMIRSKSQIYTINDTPITIDLSWSTGISRAHFKWLIQLRHLLARRDGLLVCGERWVCMWDWTGWREGLRQDFSV